MATGNTGLFGDDESLEGHLVTLFEKLEAMRQSAKGCRRTPPLQAEMRSLDFWRAVFSECLAGFFYVFVACGATAAASAASAASGTPLLTAACASGFAMAAIMQCFGHISGAHANPAVTVAMLITRSVSLLRAFMYVAAQCGGGIAGAALLYGVMAQSPHTPVLQLPSQLGSWQMFAMEFLLTFLVVFAYLVWTNSRLRFQGVSSLLIGGTYLACSLVSAPALNPARALGPSFVMNEWDDLWVYWFGPLSGGMVSGIIFEFIFNPLRTSKQAKESIDGDASSIHSDEEPYDEMDKPSGAKFQVSTYNSLRASEPCRPLSMNHGDKSNTASPDGVTKNYCTNLTAASALYSALPCQPDPVEPLYGGTKSLYSKSPLPARTNLNRSQSVYSKVPSAIRDPDGLPRPGPLVPAQSLYPMRFNHNPISTTQNIQNQQIQRSESIYGVRGIANSVNRGQTGGVYGVIHGNTAGKGNAAMKLGSGMGCGSASTANRPESMYGAATRRQDSADSSYGSYHAGAAGNNFGLRTLGSGGSYLSGSKTFSGTRNEHLHSPKGHHQLLSPVAASVISATNTIASYHHNRSPNPQY
ncbi:neurogenic protein big brain-like [Bacillus rossius redtenbacheri]|uniref:neurogenic protein big brain-like n=1 Tax=Bacillus rossius redtenbacheri TaxID=93214 RepID=UPI002FDCEF27